MDNGDSVPRGIVCTPAQYERSLTDVSIHCLTRGESFGLIVVTQAGLISLVAVLYVFTIILRNLTWRIRNTSSEGRHIFHGPMDLLMFSLFSASILQAIGAVMDIKWIYDGKVEVGRFCNAQGIVKQLGETYVAMTTLVIAVYTFLGGWLRKDIKSIPLWYTQGLLMAIWGFVALITISGNVINRGKGKSHFQSPTPYWCWINKDYLQWSIWGEYIWFWVTLAFSFVIYTPLYLWSRGNLRFDEHTWWKMSLQKSEFSSHPDLMVIRRRSLGILAYPVMYSMSVLPLSIVRWIEFTQDHVTRVPSAATFAVEAIYGLTGAFNVVLLLTTRPNSVLFSNRTHLASEFAPSLSSVQDPAYLTEEDGGIIGRLPSRSSA